MLKDVLRSFFWSKVARQTGKAEKISPQEAMLAVQSKKAVLVDVREKDEIDEGMAAPAQWIATSEIEANSPEWQRFMKQLPKDKTIIIYCAAGVRAGRAADMLASMGYRTANLGGFFQWEGAGLPTRKP